MYRYGVNVQSKKGLESFKKFHDNSFNKPLNLLQINQEIKKGTYIISQPVFVYKHVSIYNAISYRNCTLFI
jgi:hypothetical protein